MKRAFLAVLAAVSAGLLSVAAFAEDYPSQPIHVVVPFAAGGGGDFVTRAWSDKLSEKVGQPIVVENRPGGSTIVATDHVSKATPDGYTYLVVNPNFVTNNFMNETPYDSATAFAPVARFVTYPMGLAVRGDFAPKSVEDLIAVAKKDPGAINYGSSGNGSTSHLATLLLLDATGTQMQHVPYNGAGPAMADLAAGTIDMLFTGLSQSVPHVESGRVRLLGVSGGKRVSAWPDLPAVTEQIDGDYEVEVWWGLVAPAGTPDERIAKIQDALSQVMTDPGVAERYEVLNGDTTVSTTEAFSQFLTQETKKWGRIIEGAGLSKSKQ